MHYVTPPQRLTLQDFKERASINRLFNHGRTAEVHFDGQMLGYVDHNGADGLEQAHRREVSNALYLNERGAGAFMVAVPPSALVLNSYATLRDEFPQAFDWVTSNPGIGFEVKSMSLLRTNNASFTAHQAAAQIVQLSATDKTDLLDVWIERQAYTLRLVGTGKTARYIWYWQQGRTSLGQPIEAIPASLVELTMDLQRELASPTEHPSGGEDLRMLSPIGLSSGAFPAVN